MAHSEKLLDIIALPKSDQVHHTKYTWLKAFAPLIQTVYVTQV